MMSNTAPRLKATIVVAVLLAASALSINGSGAQPHRAHLSRDLISHVSRATSARARVLVQGSDADIDAAAKKLNLRILRRLQGGAVFAANAAEVNKLAAETAFEALTGDVPVSHAMTVSNLATLAEQVREGQPGFLLGLGSIPAVNGSGVGVAIVDSGIAPHAALANRVVANVSFVTGDGSVTDSYGHGTHVAGIIAGNASAAARVTPEYDGGIAPGAKLINVRVLGDDGLGYTSDVIEGINWVIANKSRYNIRVMNLSLGHPVNDSCNFDPLCQAVGRAHAAGIVVVAAAGNDGVSADGRMILGGILSPGNSPYAITVGATNTKGTASRGDDEIATYSSRGPTAYDFIVKPDIAAPGNRIISLEGANTYLAQQYSYLHRAGSGTNAYMQLSGTSMATPMVTGAVALLLQASPGLNPAQVKLALQMGADYMPAAGLIGAGAGNADFWASRRAVSSGLLSSLLSTLGSILGGSSGAAFWDSGTLSHRVFNRTGVRLLSLSDLLSALLNPSILRFGDLNLFGSNNPLSGLTGNRAVWGEVAGWTDPQREIIWGTQIRAQSSGDEIIWGTSGGDEIIWGTSNDSVLVKREPR
jgi:serine protease AprX